MSTFELRPKLLGGPYFIGSDKRRNTVLAGRLCERGSTEPIWFDGSDNFVVLQVGKRGSGKSYGMGSMLESFATVQPETAIGSNLDERGILLLDPLDIHWPALIPLSPDGPEPLRRQHAIVEEWPDLEVEDIQVQAFVPAGYEEVDDHPGIRSYRLPVSDLTRADWAKLIDLDLVQEPRGRLFDEAYGKVVEGGWESESSVYAANKQYLIDDLIMCVENDVEISHLYQSQTVRSLVQALKAYSRQPLFQSSGGTPLTTLIQPRKLSILGLARLPESIRTVLTAVVIKKLRAERMHSSQIQRRLALEDLGTTERDLLLAKVAAMVPRTILAIDEAQILLPTSGASATSKEINSYVLEGRNYGLSLWLATQRPKGAISNAAISQIDTFIVHRLTVKDDIDAVCGMLQNRQPDLIKIDRQEGGIAELIRSLSVGQAVFSGHGLSRIAVGIVRPRMVAHGGDSF